MDVEAIRREFSERERLYRQLKEEALFILEPAISSRNIKLHSTTHRVKGVDSFIDKAQRKESEKPFDEIRDIVGIRVICLFLSDIERIGEVVRESFSVIEEDNKVEGADVSSFGYMSFHFIATMKGEHSGPRYDAIANMPFEIQVRTIAMDAWANVSHYLDYKTDKDVPSELRRDFYALSGLFYVADRHFEMFFGSRKQSQERMKELFTSSASAEQLEQEINLDSLTAYLRRKFPETREANSEAVSDLIEQLRLAGYRSLDQVDEALNRGSDAFSAWDGIHAHTELTDVGVARVTLHIVDRAFHRATIDTLGLSEVDFEEQDSVFDHYRKLVQ